MISSRNIAMYDRRGQYDYNGEYRVWYWVFKFRNLTDDDVTADIEVPIYINPSLDDIDRIRDYIYYQLPRGKIRNWTFSKADDETKLFNTLRGKEVDWSFEKVWVESEYNDITNFDVIKSLDFATDLIAEIFIDDHR